MDVCCAEMVMMTSRSSQLLREINNDLDQAGVNAVDDALQDARSAVSELQDQVNSIDRQTRIVNDIRKAVLLACLSFSFSLACVGVLAFLLSSGWLAVL